MKTSYYASRNSDVLIAYIFAKKISFTICSTSITTTGMCKLGDYIYLPVSYKKTFCKVTSSIVCLVS